MKIAEIKEKLIYHGYDEEYVNSIKGKSNLLGELEAFEKNNKNESSDESDNPFSSLEPEDEDVIEHEFGSVEWNDALIGYCTEDELRDGKYPSVYALRRLVKNVLGKVVFSGVQNVYAATCPDSAGRATVVYRVDIMTNEGVVSYSDVADCWHGNSNPVYSVHPAAMASTRAEGRCLRKALGLTVNTAEEMDNPNNPIEVMNNASNKVDMEDFEKQSISSVQIALVTSKVENMKINLFKLIKREFGDKYVTLQQLSREDAANLIKVINSYQSDTNIPEEIL